MITFTNLGKFGRLGNQLFQIAATIGIARANGHDYVFPEWRYSEYMGIKIPTGTLANPVNVDEVGFHYGEIKVPAGNYNIVGYLQTEKYFVNHKDEALAYFELAPEHKIAVDALAMSYGLGQGTCSVHVRRSDYLNLQQYHPVMPMSYYEDAMDAMGDQVFIVFSDDIEWCKQNFKGRRLVFVSGHPDIYDLMLMSRCENHIIANSSFSWWGAYLNRRNKKVIAPRQWFGPAYTQHNTADLIPETWYKM